jgi:hypothetical protein
VTINGQEYTTKSSSLIVTGARQRQTAPSPPAPEPKVAGQSNRRIFITASLDRDTAYVNQEVVYLFRLYRAERLLSSPEYNRPKFPGFWVEELPPQRKFTTTVEGINYEVTEIRTGLYPTNAGRKMIAAARLKATVRSEKRQQRRPFGSNLFGFFGGGEDLHLKTDVVALTVLPHPITGRPDSWGGLVGRFEITAHADIRAVNVGDPITVAVTVRGNGNIKSIPQPQVDSVADFRMFSAGSSEEISKSGYTVSGHKTFDEVFVPQRPGSYTIPSFAVTYLDPDAGIYRTVRTDSIPVTITGAAADFTIPSFRLNPDELSDLAADVRFLKTDGDDLQTRRPPGLFGWSFWLGHLLPFSGLAVLIGWRRRVLHEAANPAARRRRLAYKKAIERLGDADSSTTGVAPAEVAQALLSFYGDRYNCAVHGQKRSEILQTLQAENVDAATITEFMDLLASCDQSRFTPGGVQSGDTTLTSRARALLPQFERQK